MLKSQTLNKDKYLSLNQSNNIYELSQIVNMEIDCMTEIEANLRIRYMALGASIKFDAKL